MIRSKCCDFALINVCIQCPFHSDGVSTDVALLCSKDTMFRETIKGTLNCVSVENDEQFCACKKYVLWSSICQH